MRFYKILLYLYPASFRNEYGEEMRQVFADRRQTASGPVAVAALVVTQVTASIVLLTALLGSLLPALRAVRVDPTTAIRME
jgi:ABC-type lipoprotein release transport system permease subunit